MLEMPWRARVKVKGKWYWYKLARVVPKRNESVHKNKSQNIAKHLRKIV